MVVDRRDPWEKKVSYVLRVWRMMVGTRALKFRDYEVRACLFTPQII
jgi:hypothetical protein